MLEPLHLAADLGEDLPDHGVALVGLLERGQGLAGQVQLEAGPVEFLVAVPFDGSLQLRGLRIEGAEDLLEGAQLLVHQLPKGLFFFLVDLAVRKLEFHPLLHLLGLNERCGYSFIIQASESSIS